MPNRGTLPAFGDILEGSKAFNARFRILGYPEHEVHLLNDDDP